MNFLTKHYLCTEHQKGLLQVSFNFLHDALLHVVGAVTLVPLKH